MTAPEHAGARSPAPGVGAISHREVRDERGAEGDGEARHLAQNVQLALVNGTVGLVMAPRGRLSRALTFTIANGKITAIEVIGDPGRLGELEVSGAG